LMGTRFLLLVVFRTPRINLRQRSISQLPRENVFTIIRGHSGFTGWDLQDAATYLQLIHTVLNIFRVEMTVIGKGRTSMISLCYMLDSKSEWLSNRSCMTTSSSFIRVGIGQLS